MQAQGVKRKDPPTSTAIVVSNKKTKNEGEIIAVESRTSHLKSPIMLLEGHQAELNAVKFSPDGQSIASAGVDKQIRMSVSVHSVLFFSCSQAVLWEVFGDCTNYDVLRGHKNAILELCWSADAQYVLLISPFFFIIFLFYLLRCHLECCSFS
jgi:Prp8 binding protein